MKQKYIFLFSQRKYLLFVIYHTISGFLDSFDGILARSLDQKSLLGQFFEFILDQYSHYIMYVCIGLLYPTYIVYFYLELALELWNSTYELYVHSLSKTDLSWLHRSTFISSMCSVTIHDHPNLRLLNWYGPDIFHTVLLIRFLLINENERKLIGYAKRYVSLEKIHLLVRFTLFFYWILCHLTNRCNLLLFS